MTFTGRYTEKKTFEKFDNEHFLLWLNEQPVEWLPETENEEHDTKPIKGFSYTGTEEDGGTIIEATEATYDAFVSGLVRLKYSADKVESVLANFQLYLNNKKHERADDFKQRWEEYQAYREECKEIAKTFNAYFPKENE